MKMAITVLDRLGYTFYTDEDGQSLFPADRFDVRLVTSLEKLPLAVGESLQCVVGVHRLDQQALLDAARFVSGSGALPSQRLLVLTERLQLPVAELRAELGLGGLQPDEVRPFRDKVVMKEHLSRQGIRVPEFAPYSHDAAMALLKKYGKVVVKPRAEAGSMDINIVSGESDLRDVEARLEDRLTDFEVEEFIDGELHHIDSVVEGSRVITATAGHSIHSTTAYLTQDHFWDIEVAPGPLFDRLRAFNDRVIACYPGFSGVTHHEVYVTADGEIVFGEIAARLGGGGIRAGLRARTGIDLVAAMIAAQVGDPLPRPTRWSEQLSGYTLVYVPGLHMTRAVDLDHPWVLEQQVYATPGSAMDPPRAWEQAAAIVTVSGRDEHEVAERLLQVQDEVRSCFEQH
ncbi:hypothetical protein OG194_33415 [Streptomyces sp. NBC_01288]|uniref:ATP-grasp domain-containing protein n=1 Tax=Streptomyces sp. NBC_01288 TaxID=2903814 RepID=UPI002E137439|nr:hypothetical protein OG194_33415 [Streptomyces sp. NBC_01288]